MLPERHPMLQLIPLLLVLAFAATSVNPRDTKADESKLQDAERYGGKTLDEWITQAKRGRRLEDRENALQIVRNFGLRHDRDKTLLTFTELLSDKALTVRSLSAAGLRKAGKPTDPMAAAKLVEIVSGDLSGLKFPRGTGEIDHEYGLALRVISALEVIGETDNVPALQRVSENPKVDSTIRLAAERAIRQIEKRASEGPDESIQAPTEDAVNGNMIPGDKEVELDKREPNIRGLSPDNAETGTPKAVVPEANRYRVLSASDEPVADAVVRLIYQQDTFRELITHVVKHETKTDDGGYFAYPNGLQVAQEMDAGGFSATWVTVPARQGQAEQTWLLGTSAGVRFPFFEAIAGMIQNPDKVRVETERTSGVNSKPPVLPTVFHLPKFETTIRVVDEGGSPAIGVEVTPSRIAWAYAGGAIKGIVVPEILHDSFRRTTDAEGRVTFMSIERMEFAEIEFRSEKHGWQRTFTNANTLGPDLVHDVILFPAGELTGTIVAATADQREFLRNQNLLLKTRVINLGLPAPKGFHIVMEGMAEITPDEQGRFGIPAMLAGQVFLLDRFPADSVHRITLPARVVTNSNQKSTVEGKVVSAVTVCGVARKRESKEPVAGIPVSIHHGGRQSGLSRQLTAYPRTDAEGRFEAKVFPGRVGYSSLSTPDGYVQAWNWDLDYDAKQEWLYGQRAIVPTDVAAFELPALEFIRAREIKGQLLHVNGKPAANTGVYARARARQNGNDFARTNANGEFVLKSFAEGYFPDFVQVGEQHKTKPARIVSRNPLILQEVQSARK